MKIEHVYCVNLERSTDRKAHMTREFERENMDVEFFPAIDGKLLGRDGAYGCAMSHLSIWRDIVAKGYENALIFEDDVTLSSGIQIHLEEIEEPGEWDIIYLHTIGPVYGMRHDSKLFTGKSLSTAGYIVSNRCAKRLHLLKPDDMGCAIDEFIATKLSLRTFIVEKPLVNGNFDLQLKSTIGISVLRVLNSASFSYWFEYFRGLEVLFIVLILILVKRLW
jgi:GR25 family glycosyltransferase involved in LPS biosynthesis